MRSFVIAFVCASFALADSRDDIVEREFHRLDKNKDGKLSPEELRAAPLIAQFLKGAELDKDGNLTLDAVRIFVASQFIGKDPKPGSKLEPVRVGPQVAKPGEAGVGRQAADISFTDINGKSGKLSDYKDKKAVVVAFTSTSCPISKKYAPALGRLEKSYREKGVVFVFVNPLATDSSEDIQAAIKANGLTGHYVHDKDGAFTAAIGAGMTTDAFVLDPTRTVIYRGAIDDQYGQGYSHDSPKQTYLAAALDALLAGKPPIVAATEAPGCALEVNKSTTTVSLTYQRDISRLVQTHCVECHRKDGVAPFSLESYKDVVAHAGEIKRVVERGTMPPWFAAPTEKGPTPWINDRSLAKNDKADFLAWLKSDRPEGDKKDAPIAKSFDAGWQIGKPDFVVRPKKPVEVKAEGTMDYQHVTVETTLDEEKWVQAMEVRPSARQVVHHVLVFVTPGKGEKPDPFGPLLQNDMLTYYAIYVPGNSAVVYPEGFGKRFPKGARVQFQIHYTPNGTATEDTTELGLIFAKEKPRNIVRVLPIVNMEFTIPPGDGNREVSAVVQLPFNAKVLGFLPHMHLRGKAFRYEVTEPGGKTETVLDVPRYDFNWQLLYNFAEPRGLPRGTKIKATGWFDNSDKNPANPNPKKTVGWGVQTFDEMMLGYVEYYVP